jgi:hypothetical protein
MRLVTAAALALLGAAAGLATGICAVAFYARPWGWWVAVIGISAALLALPRGVLRLGFGLGWIGVLGLAVLGRPEGDWVISADLSGYGLLGVGLVHLGYLIATLPVRHPEQRPPSP